MTSPGTSQSTTIVRADRPNWLLISLGGLLVVLFMGGVVFARGWGSETVTSPVPSSTGSASEAPAAKTKSTTKAAPSDTILTAVLASGAALIMAGALYSRISTITLPGDVKIGLSNKETTTTKDTAAKQAGGLTEAQVVEATTRAVEKVKEKKAATGAIELPPDDVERLTKTAVDEFKEALR